MRTYLKPFVACTYASSIVSQLYWLTINWVSKGTLQYFLHAAIISGPNGEPGVVIAHAEANDHLHRVLGKIRDLGGSPSVALNPHTPFEMIENIMDMVCLLYTSDAADE